MDPETEGQFDESKRRVASAEFDAQLRSLSDFVFSLARTSSEQHVKLDKLLQIVAPLTQTVRDDHQTISRILDILASSAEADEQIRRGFQERNARVDEEHRRLDEQIAILVRMMDEWCRRNPIN